MMDMDFAPPEPSNRDRLLMLRKRLRDEMEALRGILKKAELLASSKTIVGKTSPPAPRRGKDSYPTEAERTTAAKRRKTMPAVEIVEPGRMSERTTSAKTTRKMTVPAAMPTAEIVQQPRMSKNEIASTKKRKMMPAVEIVEPRKLERTTSAKTRKTTVPAAIPTVEIVEPRVSKDEIASVATRVSALASDMPAHILKFLKKECTGHLDEDAGEIAIDLGSMRRSAMPQLQKLLDEFAEEEKRQRQKESSMNVSTPISGLSPRKPEEGEIAEEDCDDTDDVCGDTSPVAAAKVLCSPPRTLEDGEIAEEEEEAVGCGADGYAVESEKKVAGAGDSTSSSSSCSSSGSSSSSDSSDSDSDDDSVTSSKADEDDNVRCGGASPVGMEKIAETGNNSPSSSSSSGSSSSSDSSDSDDDETVTSGPAPAVVPTARASAVAAPAHKALISSPPRSHEDGKTEATEECDGASQVVADKLDQTRNIARGNSSSSLFEDGEIEEERDAKPIFDDWIDPAHLKQLGIMEYAVTSERCVPGRGCPVQRLLGLFLKEE